MQSNEFGDYGAYGDRQEYFDQKDSLQSMILEEDSNYEKSPKDEGY